MPATAMATRGSSGAITQGSRRCRCQQEDLRQANPDKDNTLDLAEYPQALTLKAK
jgi:hypothetical protein